MVGRKFDPIKAAPWCTGGLGLGFAGPAALGAAFGGGAGAAAAAATGGSAATVTPGGIRTAERSLDRVLNDAALFEPWLRRHFPANQPYSGDTSRKTSEAIQRAGLQARIDPGHGTGFWTGPHITDMLGKKHSHPHYALVVR